MAGQTLGAPSPVDSTPLSAPRRTLQLVPGSTRTRRSHGVFTLAGQLACVYSTRRAGACYGVSFELGAGTLTLASSMTPGQARAMARALSAAADAAEAVQAQQCGGAL